MNKGRKITGGKYMKSRKKKIYDLLGQKKNVKLGEDKRKAKKQQGIFGN